MGGNLCVVCVGGGGPSKIQARVKEEFKARYFIISLLHSKFTKPYMYCTVSLFILTYIYINPVYVCICI